MTGQPEPDCYFIACMAVAENGHFGAFPTLSKNEGVNSDYTSKFGLNISVKFYKDDSRIGHPFDN